ncbi:MAG: RNA polymerase sigma-70 factor [Prolixibacteraceae bacterium]|nr:RNA polymerase sigma-70 factor [Prolixibacteraceae bacterium]
MSITSQHIDYRTVKNLREGDVKAFDDLFKKYSPRLYNFSVKYLKSDEEAEEVVQEVFLYIWEKRDGLKPDSSFNAYLFTIAHNIIKKHFIKKSRENTFKDALIYEFLKQENNLDQLIDYKFLLEKVESIIDVLPVRRKEIFIRRKYDGLPVRQIADELSISPNTVENQLATAQKQILSELKKEKLAGLLFFTLFISM